MTVVGCGLRFVSHIRIALDWDDCQQKAKEREKTCFHLIWMRSVSRSSQCINYHFALTRLCRQQNTQKTSILFINKIQTFSAAESSTRHFMDCWFDDFLSYLRPLTLSSSSTITTENTLEFHSSAHINRAQDFTILSSVECNTIILISLFVVAIAWCLDDVITRLIFDQLRPWWFNFTSSRHFAHERDESPIDRGRRSPSEKVRINYTSQFQPVHELCHDVGRSHAVISHDKICHHRTLGSGAWKKNFFGLPNLSLLVREIFTFFFNLFFLRSFILFTLENS